MKTEIKLEGLVCGYHKSGPISHLEILSEANPDDTTAYHRISVENSALKDKKVLRVLERLDGGEKGVFIAIKGVPELSREGAFFIIANSLKEVSQDSFKNNMQAEGRMTKISVYGKGYSATLDCGTKKKPSALPIVTDANADPEFNNDIRYKKIEEGDTVSLKGKLLSSIFSGPNGQKRNFGMMMAEKGSLVKKAKVKTSQSL